MEFSSSSEVKPPSTSLYRSRLASRIWPQTGLICPSGGRRRTPSTRPATVSASKPLHAAMTCACLAGRLAPLLMTCVQRLNRLVSLYSFAHRTYWAGEAWRFCQTNNNWTATCARPTSHLTSPFWSMNTSATPRKSTSMLPRMVNRSWLAPSWNTSKRPVSIPEIRPASSQLRTFQRPCWSESQNKPKPSVSASKFKDVSTFNLRFKETTCTC